jgi:hypothetical protein
MAPQVVQNPEYLPASLLGQGFQELNQLVRVERLINDHPARLALVGDGGNHRQLLARATHCTGHGRLPCRYVTASAYIGVDQGGFIAPVNLRPFGLGALLNLGVLLIQPGLHASGRCS